MRMYMYNGMNHLYIFIINKHQAYNITIATTTAIYLSPFYQRATSFACCRHSRYVVAAHVPPPSSAVSLDHFGPIIMYCIISYVM